MSRQYLFGLAVVVAIALGTVAAMYMRSPEQPVVHADDSGNAKATFWNAAGDIVGEAKLKQKKDGVEIYVQVHDLPQGFHGFHVHAVGICTISTPPFTSAGGHYNPAVASHPGHAADLPVLLVKADGTGEAQVKTDRFALADLFDADGGAFIIHANPDNYANIPALYLNGPQTVIDPATTLATGDAGGRIACGVIEAGNGD